MSDQDTTDQMPTAEPPTEPQLQRPKRLLRSREDRMLGGVAGGLANYFGVDALIFRIGFGVTVFFGGIGALAYLAMVLFVPSEESDGSVGEPPIQRSRWLAIAGAAAVFIFFASWGIFDGNPGWGDGGWFFGGPLLLIAVVAALFYAVRNAGDRRADSRGLLATVAIAIGAAIGLTMLALLAAWAGATGGGEAVAAVIVGIGVLLVLAAFRGGARWLIAPALALALPLSAVAAADVSFDGGVGQRNYEPVSFASIPDDGYEHGVGEMTIDLRSLDWRSDTVLDLRVNQGVGHVAIAVPETVCVSGDLDLGAGLIEVAGDEADGFDVESTPEAGTSATPRLVLDANLDLGYLEVVNDDDADIGDGRHFHGDRETSAMEAAMAEACADEPATPKEQG
jgi:phage shock protein PspC (stress-responsive transcriptional regulator)